MTEEQLRRELSIAHGKLSAYKQAEARAARQRDEMRLRARNSTIYVMREDLMLDLLFHAYKLGTRNRVELTPKEERELRERFASRETATLTEPEGWVDLLDSYWGYSEVLLDANQVADWLHVSPGEVRAMARDGSLPHARRDEEGHPGRYYFRPSDLREWARQGERANAA